MRGRVEASEAVTRKRIAAAARPPMRVQASHRFDRVLLYIGPPKTGTTSNQRFVWKNRDALIAQGIFTPMSGMAADQHVVLPALLTGGPRQSARSTRLAFQANISAAGLQTRGEVLVARLGQELAAAPPCHTLFLMSEAIFACGSDEIDLYREFFAPLADRLESLMYLRRQDRWLASLTLQNRKSGTRAGLDLNRGMPKRFSRNVRGWRSRSDRCQIRRFEADSWVRGSLIWDFCDALGADPAGLDMSDIRANPALTQEQLELVDALNGRIAGLSFERRVAIRKGLLGLAFDTLGGAKIEFPRAVAEAAFASYEEINRWLGETIDPNGRPLYFDTDFSDYQAAPTNDRRYSMDQLSLLLTRIEPAAIAKPDREPLIDQIITSFLEKLKRSRLAP